MISLLRKKVLTIKKSVKISSILWYYFKDQVCKYLQDNSFTEYWYVYLIYSLMPVIGYLWMYQNNIWSRINDKKYSLLFPWTWAWGKDFKIGHFKNTWHCNSNPEVKNNNGKFRVLLKSALCFCFLTKSYLDNLCPKCGIYGYP